MKRCLHNKSVVIVIIAVFLCTGIVLADAMASRTVTVTCDPMKTPNFGQCDAGETLTVINGCTDAIEVKFNDGDFQTVAATENAVFDCTDDPDCYTVQIPAKSLNETGCEFGAVPSMSPWGFAALAILLTVSGWIFMRRRRVAA